jgi:hypothetical protein
MVEIILYLGSAFVILLGIAVTRVGLYGEHLGRFKLVSYVKKYAEQPSSHHRYITVGIGMVSILLGLGFLIFQFVFLHQR